jgi:iron complex outermembrane receptor protein
MLKNTLLYIENMQIPDLFSKKLQGFDMIIRVGLAAFLILAVGNFSAKAQESITVSGIVTDATDGQTLPGVNVVVKGTTTGVSTDGEGYYQLNVPSTQDTLVFSFVGYVSQEVPVQGRENLDIALASSIQELDDVVVVGYGTQKEREVTSAITTVKAEDFNAGAINDPTQLIEGKVPGLSVNRVGADPNQGSFLLLRGLSSIGANAEPLVVVDGIPGASLQSVDPNDIASINVLKDASASAIYGTRGAGGVILVTTKTGVAAAGKDGLQVDYNGYAATRIVADKIDVLSAEEFVERGGTDLGSSTDFFDEVIQPAPSQSHSLALSGNNGNTNYRISLNFRDEEGIAKETGFQTLNGRLNLTQFALNDNLKFTVDLSANTADRRFGFGEVFRYAALFNPTAPVTLPNDSTSQFGQFFQQSGSFDTFNPVAITEQSTNIGESQRITGSLNAEYDFSDILPGFILTGRYSLQRDDGFNGTYYGREGLFRGAGRNGLARKFSFSNEDELFEATANYVNNLQIGNNPFNLDLIAGYSFQEFTSINTTAEGGDFLTDAFSFNNLSAAQDFDNGLGSVDSFQGRNRLIAFFGRANLNYDQTYFLSGSLRREGSSRFGVNNKWGLFPGVSAGVQVTNLVDIPSFDQLKLRAGYGKTGQNAPFDLISQFTFGPTGSFLVNGEFIPSFGPQQNPNPDLKFEVKEEFNFGIDFALLESRLTGSVDYFITETKDLIFAATVPVPPNITNTQFLNLGNLKNEGIEVAAGYRVINTDDIVWQANATFSRSSKTELVSLSNDRFDFGNEQFFANAGSPGLNTTPLIRVREGDPIGNFFGPVFAGVDENGNYLFRNLDRQEGEPELIGTNALTDADNTVIGNGLPDFQIGFGSQVNVKNFDLSFFFKGVFGHELINTFRLFYENTAAISQNNVLSSTFDRENPVSEAAQFSSLYVEDASFLRLDNVNIGYNFSLPGNSPVRKFRIYASGQNLFTITNYSGVDPSPRPFDVGPADNGGFQTDFNTLAPGVDRRNNWFTARSFTLGVNLSF